YRPQANKKLMNKHANADKRLCICTDRSEGINIFSSKTKPSRVKKQCDTILEKFNIFAGYIYYLGIT
ncbi:MAG: hypothetical protein CMN98_00660, partial [Synechococcus sp. NP17]|nr:hypothetical protein [Synechococcus sp. NP17]